MHATLSQAVGLLAQHEVEARRCIVAVLCRRRHPSGGARPRRRRHHGYHLHVAGGKAKMSG